MNLPIVVLAIDLGSILFVVFALVSLVSWIRNQANAGQAPPPGRRPPIQPGPARNPQIQREIERFLREAAGQAPPRQPQRPVLNADEIEIVEPQSARRPPPRRKVVEKPRPATGNRPAVKPRTDAAAPTPRPGEDLARRHLAPAPKSAVAAEHLPQAPAGRLPHDVDKSVSAHLGAFVAAESGPTRQSQRPRPTSVLAELRTRRGIRSAIIMYEILQRPRALQRRSR